MILSLWQVQCLLVRFPQKQASISNDCVALMMWRVLAFTHTNDFIQKLQFSLSVKIWGPRTDNCCMLLSSFGQNFQWPSFSKAVQDGFDVFKHLDEKIVLKICFSQPYFWKRQVLWTMALIFNDDTIWPKHFSLICRDNFVAGTDDNTISWSKITKETSFILRRSWPDKTFHSLPCFLLSTSVLQSRNLLTFNNFSTVFLQSMRGSSKSKFY